MYVEQGSCTYHILLTNTNSGLEQKYVSKKCLVSVKITSLNMSLVEMSVISYIWFYLFSIMQKNQSFSRLPQIKNVEIPT